MFETLQTSLLSLIYPQQCRVCAGQVENVKDGVACSHCWSATRIFKGSEMLCGKCGAFLGEEAASVPVFCHKCDDYHFDRAFAVGIYEQALAASIIDLKTKPVLAGRINSLISQSLCRADFVKMDVIVPVPLSRQRKHERGFNQAEIIARSVARVSGLQVDRASLARKRHTPIHRIGMDQKAREMTVKNAFEIVRPKLIEGKNILLVDDVLTSGATSSYCAQILKKKGASRVNVFTLARAVMQ